MTVAQHKVNHILDKKMRYEQGIMTRREWIELQKNSGAIVVEYQKPSVVYDRHKFNRMDGKQQEEYEKKLEKMIPCYKLKEGNESDYFYEITKTEFQYFLSL